MLPINPHPPNQKKSLPVYRLNKTSGIRSQRSPPKDSLITITKNFKHSSQRESPKSIKR